MTIFYVSCTVVYFRTYKHPPYPITSAWYTHHLRPGMPSRMHSRSVFDFHYYLISLYKLFNSSSTSVLLV